MFGATVNELGLGTAQASGQPRKTLLPALAPKQLLDADAEDVKSYLMFDFVSYNNRAPVLSERPRVTREIHDGADTQEGRLVVGEHVDPGLFVLSLAADAEGLQLYDRARGAWVDAKSTSASGHSLRVLWCGEAAHSLTGGRIPAALHRVV